MSMLHNEGLVSLYRLEWNLTCFNGPTLLSGQATRNVCWMLFSRPLGNNHVWYKRRWKDNIMLDLERWVVRMQVGWNWFIVIHWQAYVQSNPNIVLPSVSTHESVWTWIPCYAVFCFTYILSILSHMPVNKQGCSIGVWLY